jgi:hypothetical protein
VNWYYIFGASPGASEASTKQAENVNELVSALFPALWLIFLFLVPAFMDALRGPRNSFALMMFAWAIAFSFLVGAFVVSEGGPNPLVYIFGTLFAIFIGCFGGLGYTASESYLDLCAEWMPIALTQTSHEGGGKKYNGGVDADPNVDGTPSHLESLLSNEAVENHAEKLAKAELHHRAEASKYKGRFASHLYAIIEVGAILFSLPPVIGGDAAMMPLTIAIAVCLFVSAIGSLFLYNIQLPPEHLTHQGLAENDVGEIMDIPNDQVANSSFVRNALRSASKSFVICFTCLSAYRWLAALAIVPYFFIAEFSSQYLGYIIQGDQCGMLQPPEGIAIQGTTAMNLVGAVTQAITSFIGPLLVGSGKFQFKEYVYPMAVSIILYTKPPLTSLYLTQCSQIGNLVGMIGPVLIIAQGGINGGLCGSYETQIVLQILNSIPYAIGHSVGIAAVLSWYDGPYQHLTVAALASRSIWTQLGDIAAPFVYKNLGFLADGIPCAIMTAVLYFIGALCVLAAHWINNCWVDTVDEITDGESLDSITPRGVRRMSAGFSFSEKPEISFSPQDHQIAASGRDP